ncbi:MAG: SAM-dependent methyltransferase [Deltaproteobacteria bacterium]|nr:SAM-dependent methyltransferase [Deltaproteobacteria bacterium]
MPEGLVAGSCRGSAAKDLVIRLIAEKGPLPFSSFMEAALYSPEGGYYTSGGETWGPRGDYITSLDVSPVFARTLARQVTECWELLGSPSSFELIEAGAGRGLLSSAILSHVKDACPALYDAMTVRLVERGAHPEGSAGGKVFWHRELGELAPVEAALVLSNELIDSFPVHRVCFSGGKLKELFVDFDGESFFEVEGPLSESALSGYFDRAGIRPFEGMKTEVNLDAGRWIRKASSLFSRGFVVTIDYGTAARELYSVERGSSLHCHFRHKLNDNPFVNVGEQDITTHVDFTTFALESLSAGLSLTGFTTQKNFLLGLGVLDELKTPSSLGADGVEEVNFNRALGQLISPGGMGDIFKVLVGHKGVERPRLRGVSFKDMARSLCLP